MPYDFQVAVDCADPHALADWWAETLDWVVEEPDPVFIRRMIAEGYATDADTATHNGRLVWRDGAEIRHPDGPETGRRRRIIFQLVPEGKRGRVTTGTGAVTGGQPSRCWPGRRAVVWSGATRP